MEFIQFGYYNRTPHPEDKEKDHEIAVADGLAHFLNIDTIWCSERLIESDKRTFKNITNKEGRYGYTVDLEVLKQYDIAILDEDTCKSRNEYSESKKVIHDGHPSYLFQLKKNCHDNAFCALALSDLLWGCVDKFHAEKQGREVEVVMVWAEHTDYKEKSNNILRMDEEASTMQYVLNPSGFTKLKEGNDYSWSDSKNRRIEPKSLSFLTRGVAGQTGTSYYNMLRKKGSLIINTEYRQFLESGWRVYVHRITSWELLKGETATGEAIEDPLQWVP